MSDPREVPFAGRDAVPGPGEEMQVTAGVTALLRAPGGPRERELLFGETFRVLEREGAHAYGMAGRDGYCGWVALADLGAGDRGHGCGRGARDLCQGHAEGFGDRAGADAVLRRPGGGDGAGREMGADRHARGRGLAAGGASAAGGGALDRSGRGGELFLGTPYLWGGNSGRGIDCSGMVQAAYLACGVPCPGDSDQQEARLGDAIPAEAEVQRGDLFFWPGHVAVAADAERLIHANGHAMMVCYEGLRACVARIAAAEGKPVTRRRRVTLPRG